MTKSNKPQKDSMSKPTRRQVLKATTFTAAAGLAMPGVAAARNDEPANIRDSQASAEFLEARSELPSKWWAKDSSEIAAKTSENVALVGDGIDHWVSVNKSAPEWFTIDKEDELRYKPHGVYSLADAGMCAGTTVEVGPFEVGIEVCHYGGCEWKAEVCYGGCIGTGRQDNCDSIHTMSADLGVVKGDLEFNPHLGWGRDNEIGMNGELCYYYVLDSGCKTASHTFDL
jgi:hypothetical protein